MDNKHWLTKRCLREAQTLCPALPGATSKVLERRTNVDVEYHQSLPLLEGNKTIIPVKLHQFLASSYFQLYNADRLTHTQTDRHTGGRHALPFCRFEGNYQVLFNDVPHLELQNKVRCSVNDNWKIKY